MNARRKWRIWPTPSLLFQAGTAHSRSSARLLPGLNWGLHRKPCGILNIHGYYDPLLAQFDGAVTEGFLHPANRGLVVQATDAEILLDLLEG